MKYFLVFGRMFNKVVIAKDASEVKGKIIRELTAEEAKAYASGISNIENI